MINEKYIVNELRKFNPKAIALWGSYGMGVQDRFTHDVDIVVYVDKTPNKELKKKILQKLAMGKLSLPWGGDFFVRDNEIYEITFIICKDIEQKIKDIKIGRTYGENDIAIFVVGTRTLYDTGWLKSQKTKAMAYPQELFRSVFKENLLLSFRKIHHYNRALNKRNQPLWAQYVINRGVNYLVRTIFAANKKYYGKDKWIEYEMSKFKIKPKRFEQKLVELLKARDIKLYEQLVKEVYNICKKHYPKESKEVFETDRQLQKLDAEIELKKLKI